MQKENLSANCNALLKRRYIFKKKIIRRLYVVYQFKWISTTSEFFFSQRIHSEYKEGKCSLNSNHRSLNKTFICRAAGPGQHCRLTSSSSALGPGRPPLHCPLPWSLTDAQEICAQKWGSQTIFNTESFAISITLPSDFIKILI